MDGKKLTHRLTIDIDNPNKKKAMAKAKKMLANKNVEFVEVFKSPSGNGFHLYATLKKPIAFRTQFYLRKKYGDCKKRLAYSIRDLKRGMNPDVMFTHKRYGKKWKTEVFLKTILKDL